MVLALNMVDLAIITRFDLLTLSERVKKKEEGDFYIPLSWNPLLKT